MALVFQDHAALAQLGEIMRSQSFDLRKEAARSVLNISVHGQSFLDSVLSLNLLSEFLFYLRGTDADARTMTFQFLELVLRLRPDGPAIMEQHGAGELLLAQLSGGDADTQAKVTYLLTKMSGA